MNSKYAAKEAETNVAMANLDLKRAAMHRALI